MESTQKNFEIFKAQYWGQNVGRGKLAFTKLTVNKSCILNIDYLELTNLKDISDEDVLECVRILYNNPNGNYPDLDLEESKEDINDFLESQADDLIGNIYVFSILNLFYFLRSKGYLIPFNGLSCEEIISRGWAKYKTK